MPKRPLLAALLLALAFCAPAAAVEAQPEVPERATARAIPVAPPTDAAPAPRSGALVSLEAERGGARGSALVSWEKLPPPVPLFGGSGSPLRQYQIEEEPSEPSSIPVPSRDADTDRSSRAPAREPGFSPYD